MVSNQSDAGVEKELVEDNNDSGKTVQQGTGRHDRPVSNPAGTPAPGSILQIIGAKHIYFVGMRSTLSSMGAYE